MMFAFSLFRRFSTVSILLAFALAVAVPASRAQSTDTLDKHGRKIEKELSKFHPGSYLEFDFRDRTANFGALGQLSATTFQYTDSDNNKVVTRSYNELEHVSRAKEFIGEGSRHHHVRLWVPVTVAALAAGGGAAAYEMTR
jgi:hypothetical protein